MGYEKPKSGAERVAKRRAALRAQGLRPRTFWLPDTRTPEFREQARRDCEALWEEARRNPELYEWVAAMVDETLATIPPWEEDD